MLTNEVAMYCPGCGEPNARGATLCAACGTPLPVEQPLSPAPAPASPPQILRPPVTRPAPLRPPPLDPLPPSGRGRPPVDELPLPPMRDAVVPREVSMPSMPVGGPPPVSASTTDVSRPPPASFGASAAPSPSTGASPVAAPAAPRLVDDHRVPAAPAPIIAAPVSPASAPILPPSVAAPAAPTAAPPPRAPTPIAPAPLPRAAAAPRPVVDDALAVDSTSPTLIEEARQDSSDFNDVTDPGLPPFDDTPDVTAASATGEGSPLDDDEDDAVPVPRTLPRVSFAAPSVMRYAIASLVDGGLAAAPALAVAFLLAGDEGAPFLERVIQTLALSPAGLVAFVVVALTVSAAHHAFLVPRLGATAGGVVTGIGVRTMDGASVSPIRAATRGALIALSSVVFLVGPLYALWIDDGRRGLADRVARTRLVTRRAGGRT